MAYQISATVILAITSTMTVITMTTLIAITCVVTTITIRIQCQVGLECQEDLLNLLSANFSHLIGQVLK